MTVKEILKELGGVQAVAKACGISQPATSYWCRKGIPELRVLQLKVLFPEKAHLFNAQTVQPEAAPSGD